MSTAVEQAQPATTSTDDFDYHFCHVIPQEITPQFAALRLNDDEKSSPSAFRKYRVDIYPNVAMWARVYLTPCASSQPIEGLFSVTGLIMNARRSSIAPHKTQQTLLCARQLW